MNSSGQPTSLAKSDVRFALVTLYGFQAFGARSIYSALKARGFDVSLVFFKDLVRNRNLPPTESETERLLTVLESLHPDLVGFSVRSSFAGIAAELSRAVTERLHLPVIWGGTHPTVMPENCLERADFVCRGEGEEVMVELLECLRERRSPKGIRNLWIRQGGEVQRNPLRPLCQELDRLPLPDYADEGKFVIEDGQLRLGEPIRADTTYQIMTARGCPFRCSYCSNSVLQRIFAEAGPFVRRRSVAGVLEELIYARRSLPKLKRVFFLDEVFASQPAWIREFVPRYQREVGLPFACEFHPLALRKEILDQLIEAGLDTVYMGIQSGSERVRRQVLARPVSDAQLTAACALLHRQGIQPIYDLILDNPFETSADQRDTFEFMAKVPHPYHLNLFSLTHFPGTDLTTRALAEGVITEEEVEHRAGKALSQWRVTSEVPRPPEAVFWNCLISMLSKPFVPRRMVRLLSRSSRLRRHPAPVGWLAGVCNTAKLAVLGAGMLLRGELNLPVFRSYFRNARAMFR